MNEVLISIRPEWCELIEKGQKTIEVIGARELTAWSFAM